MTAAATGTALECFEFTPYGAVFATILPKLFFPVTQPTGGLNAPMMPSSIGLAASTPAAMAKRYKFTGMIDKTASLMGKTFAPRPVHFIPSGRVLCCMMRRAG